MHALYASPEFPEHAVLESDAPPDPKALNAQALNPSTFPDAEIHVTGAFTEGSIRPITNIQK